jgi:hypothetical protein
VISGRLSAIQEYKIENEPGNPDSFSGMNMKA